jgi:hypothetical protein
MPANRHSRNEGVPGSNPGVGFNTLWLLNGDHDLVGLSDGELKARIATLAEQKAGGNAVDGGRRPDAMRIELVRRIRARHESGRDDEGGTDEPSGMRTPTRPTPPSNASALPLPGTDGS